MDLTSGYLQRVMRSATQVRVAWHRGRLKQNYFFDIRLIRHGKVDDDALLFTKHRAAVPVSA